MSGCEILIRYPDWDKFKNIFVNMIDNIGTIHQRDKILERYKTELLEAYTEPKYYTKVDSEEERQKLRSLDEEAMEEGRKFVDKFVDDLLLLLGTRHDDAVTYAKTMLNSLSLAKGV
ncbi:hypothetical protein C6Y03_01030 [Bacillus sp. LNXM65]|uniref:hypothetical protein n=1 Tax=Bacillus sp. LNXM65 TaxID=2108540 RepID=UPI000D025093|nr:hypothetical protein [Bacillus sp. LNXM65]PRS77193.1 hypothetical protein C6Y03_01030 [Bacillus sp. LNXM65]